jgi:transcriptional regulator
MYRPSHHAENDPEVLRAAIREIAFGTLVITADGTPQADHVPFHLTDDGTRLVTHLARANPQAARIAAGVPALVTFVAADAYVSPGWYATKAQTGKVVPIWNYVAVHARGTARTFDDPARLLALVSALTDAHEAGRPVPWRVSDAPDGFVDGLLRAIVGVEIAIDTLEGKWKMSQNRPAADRLGVIAGLAAGDAMARRAAEIMRGIEDGDGRQA